MSSDIYAKPNLTQKVKIYRKTQKDRAEWEEKETDIYESADIIVNENTVTQLHEEGQQNQNQPQKVKGCSRKATSCKTTVLHVMLAGIIILSTYFILVIKLNNSYNQLKDELLANNSQIQRSFRQLLEDVKKIKNKTEGRWCSDRWTRFEDKCYFKSTEKKSWSDGRKQCQDHGADLVIINTEEEQKFVAELSVNEESWIGLKKVTSGQTNEWTWVDGSPLKKEYWGGWRSPPYYSAACYTRGQKWECPYENQARNWICEK